LKSFNSLKEKVDIGRFQYRHPPNFSNETHCTWSGSLVGDKASELPARDSSIARINAVDLPWLGKESRIWVKYPAKATATGRIRRAGRVALIRVAYAGALLQSQR
jgi:hypothetical protein